MGVSLAIGAVLLTPLALADPPSSASLTSDAILSLVVLGLLCTAAAFVVMAVLVADVGPGRALVITYVNPVVAGGPRAGGLGERPPAGARARPPPLIPRPPPSARGPPPPPPPPPFRPGPPPGPA